MNSPNPSKPTGNSGATSPVASPGATASFGASGSAGTTDNANTDAPRVVGSTQHFPINDPMIVDNPEVELHSSSLRPSNSIPVDTHVSSGTSSTSAVNTFDENAEQVLLRIRNLQEQLRLLTEKEKIVMGTPTTTVADFQLREYQTRSLEHDFAYYRNQLLADNKLYSSFKDTSVSLLSNQTQVLSLNDAGSSTFTREKDHSDIPAKDIPVFNVKYSECTTNPDSSSSDDLSLNSFIRKFERAYKNHGVNVELHWLFHLEASFENNDNYSSWFLQNFKLGAKNKKKTWSEAKKTLEHRFDPFARLGLIKVNFMLHSMRQYSHEPLAEYTDRFGSYLRAAKVQTHDNFFFTVGFLSSLHTKEFQDKVQERMVEYMKEQIHGPDSSMVSKYATHSESQFLEFYSNFSRVSDALNYHLGNLENSLQEIQARNNGSSKVSSSSSSSSSSSLPSSSGSSSSKDASKKRKLDEKSTIKSNFNKSNINYEKVFDPTYKLNDDERVYIRKQQKCLSCRVVKFSPEHLSECPERKKYFASKVSNPSNNQVAVLSTTLDETVSNTPSNSRISNEQEESLNDESFIFDNDNEFLAAFNDLDNFIMHDNDEIELDSKNNFFNKNIFSISINSTSPNCLNSFSLKSNTVGDIDNPFETDNVAYSPVSPIIINSVKTYCTIDTGAQVSIMNKQFAVEHNIEFEQIKGTLLFVDGTQIQRQRTTQPLSIDYDGVEKTVSHKFDIVDNKYMTSSNQILAGADLMLKLNMRLINVAHKYKDTSKSVDDSIDDQAYVPNVTPFGTEKEQIAFNLALKPYIEANKALDKNSFCNIPESVLHLPTPPDYHVHVRQYPIAYKLQPKVMEVINDWVDSGIITRAPASAWNLPITVTLKKNHESGVTSSKDSITKDDIRVVLDTRLLNKALPTVNETQPLINDIFFTSMEGCLVFSTIDLKSAFSQFLVNPDDQIKTSFTGPDNLKYMHVGSPFGVSTISQLFSRVVLSLFKDLSYVRTFIDDICIMSRSLDAHFQHVKHVVSILTQANLRINFKKSHFAKSEVYLLGFSISARGRRIDTRKLSNLESLPRPVTSKQCQSFLGFVNYFRQHIPNAAMLMAPIDFLRSHDEKNKGKRFEWSSTHDMHFNHLKQILVSDVVLSHPNFSLPFCIATDASDFAIGCSLFQEEKVKTANGDTKKLIKHIGFFSRKLSSSEVRYSCTMREMLACVFALKQFHKFIWGTHFTLYSDHKALSYLHTQKHSNSMMIKWLDTILDYDFKVVYIKGIDNILPDALSRLYPPVDPITDHSKPLRVTSPGNIRAISESINLKKKELSVRSVQIHESFNQNSHMHLPSFRQNELYKRDLQDSNVSANNALKNAIPLCDNKTNDSSRKLFYIQSGQSIHADYLVAPESERSHLLEDAHNKVGHYGAEQMVKRLHQEGIHWPKLINDCIEYIRKCTECQKHNIQKKGYHPYRPIYSYLPGDHYAIDLGGPINTTSVRGNNYFLVIVCVATRFCVLRPLQDKRSDTVITALVEVFSILGFPCGGVLQSDNGGDFKHRLAADLAKAMGFDHRFITPMHASANGISERFVQSVKRLLAKATQGVGNDWDLHLNAVQLALNNRISKKLNSTPFSLMFARKMAEPFGFRNINSSVPPEQRKPISHEELMKRIDYMADIVFPAIHAKTMAQLDLEKAKFDNKHLLVDYPAGSHVMVRLQTKAGQLAPSYVGPYSVVRKNRGNSYILRDHTGALMPRNYTSVELKLISQDEVIELDDEGNEMKSYEVEAIINHRGTPTKREYLVRWKNYSSDWDEWIDQSQFNATDTLRDYWKKLGVPYKPKKSNVVTNSPTSISVLKKNPPGSVSTLINSLTDDTSSDDTTVIHTTVPAKTAPPTRTSLRHQANTLVTPVNPATMVPHSNKRKNLKPTKSQRRSKRRSVTNKSKSD